MLIRLLKSTVETRRCVGDADDDNSRDKRILRLGDKQSLGNSAKRCRIHFNWALSWVCHVGKPGWIRWIHAMSSDGPWTAGRQMVQVAMPQTWRVIIRPNHGNQRAIKHSYFYINFIWIYFPENAIFYRFQLCVFSIINFSLIMKIFWHLFLNFAIILLTLVEALS